MRKSAEVVLRQLTSRLRDQALEMTTLRATVDAQFRRIANMQTALLLEQLPHGRQTASDKTKTKKGGATGGDSS
jgi:hypothetical protein